ncbi:hypothetical protein WPS_17550 [Vulcanimicrobium alpinum]|uniref:Circadian input-output histidine kinase CikA n=1 Tax=Vulcanimicrobium alpinum TaxID=3016050 RepID=A0AAN2C9N3_UNVUL|nr:hypothetical protein WPS_17550 [Vulcanimicrobium alpinum]
MAILSLFVAAAATAPVAHTTLGTFPGFSALYGGAVVVGLAITAAIVFTQFAATQRPSLLALACGLLFCAIVFVPYILTIPVPGSAAVLGQHGNATEYLQAAWGCVLTASFVAYASISRREGGESHSGPRVAAALFATLAAAYIVIDVALTFGKQLPSLADERYLPGVVFVRCAMVVFAAVALVLLQWRPRHSVADVWLMVPAAALLAEPISDALGGGRYTVGWYLSHADVLIATTCLVIALLFETNRISRILTLSERRLRGIVNGVTDALIVVDPGGAIVSVNPAAERLFGLASPEARGAPVTQLLPDFDHAGPIAYFSAVETTARHARGELFPIELARGRDSSNESGETIVIVRDITQRKAADEAIRQAHDRAVEAAEVKSQFLATMSHEIRTPINAVVGMSELLMQTRLDDEAREYATTVRDSAESLLGIVNDILDFSKIEAGRMELEAAPFSPLVAVENATDILAAAARKKGLSLSTFVAPDVPQRVIGDADRLRQVLLNLLGNAVKFTAEGSVSVRAVVERIDGEDAVMHFSVTDTGPGIAPELADRLFEPFRQADQSTRRRYGGTGLGLSISRRIVELMGGRIGFDSSVGRGSTFWFTVPLTRVPDDLRGRNDALRGRRILVVDDETVARQVIDQYLLAWGAVASSTGNAAHGLELARAMAARGIAFEVAVIDRRAGGDGFSFAARMRSAPELKDLPLVLVTGSEEPAAEARARGFSGVVRKPIRQVTLHDALAGACTKTMPGPRLVEPLVMAPPREIVNVLVAEDNPVNRKLALQQLKKLGYAAHAVVDGREAIDAVASGAYDVVLMDCQMPEVDGFEATRAIRRAEATRGGHIPILAMTANALEGDREQCLAAGMDEYLAKPVQLATLSAAIERFVNGIGVAG